MIQKRYEGYLKTPVLWKGDAVSNLYQFEILLKFNSFSGVLDEKTRLGKYVERFVSFELKQQSNISILAENIQIQKDKITLGELDCLLLKDEQPIHLEIIYKFYLYDKSVGETEIEHFIGPNKKDSLIEKTNKLKDKQLPLLHSNACKVYLDKLNLKVENIEQQVYFKAQLFMPYNNKEIQLKTLNNDCISGLYITYKELANFINCKFYIPNKKDWLIKPNSNVTWLNFNNFKTLTKNYFDEKFSTLCWVKKANGEINKIFLVWW